MKRLLFWTIWLYPSRWRVRYRGELEALIEDSDRAGWTELLDVMKGAIAMNFHELSVAKMIGGFVLIGLVAASVAWALMPAWYQSVGVVRSEATTRQINKAVMEVRANSPDEDLRRTIVRRLDAHQFTIAVQDQNPTVAQAKAQTLQTQIMERITQAGSAAAAISVAGIARRQREEMAPLAGLGGALGLLCGAIAVLIKRTAFRLIVAFAASGALVGALACAAIPRVYRSTAAFEVTSAANPVVVQENGFGRGTGGSPGTHRQDSGLEGREHRVRRRRGDARFFCLS